MKQPLPWYLRVGITLFITLSVAVPVVHFVFPVLVPWVDSQDWSFGGRLSFGVVYAMRVAFDVIVFSCLPMFACIGCYHFLSFRHHKRGETYCGKCHSLLKNLTEPVCPTCGSVI